MTPDEKVWRQELFFFLLLDIQLSTIYTDKLSPVRKRLHVTKHLLLLLKTENNIKI